MARLFFYTQCYANGRRKAVSWRSVALSTYPIDMEPGIIIKKKKEKRKKLDARKCYYIKIP